MILTLMAVHGQEPVGSMGNDMLLAYCPTNQTVLTISNSYSLRLILQSIASRRISDEFDGASAKRNLPAEPPAGSSIASSDSDQ
jgi:hypothetical protein